MENHEDFESTDTYFVLFFTRVLDLIYDMLGINTLFILSDNFLANGIMNELLSPFLFFSFLFGKCENSFDS